MSERNIVIAIVLLVALVWLYMENQKPYAGAVATGWGGGNAQGNLPGIWSPTNIVAKGITAMTNIFGGPGVQYGPSTTTNQGSAG